MFQMKVVNLCMMASLAFIPRLAVTIFQRLPFHKRDMQTKAIEMLTESGAEALIVQMGRRMKTKARSKVIARTVGLIREQYHPSDVAAWFSEKRFMGSRRTTVRVSPDIADYLSVISDMVGQGRPAVLLDLVYFAAAHLSREDLESLRP